MWRQQYYSNNAFQRNDKTLLQHLTPQKYPREGEREVQWEEQQAVLRKQKKQPIDLY